MEQEREEQEKKRLDDLLDQALGESCSSRRPMLVGVGQEVQVVDV